MRFKTKLLAEFCRDEWEVLNPTAKEMGVVQLVLNQGVRTRAIGHLYGLDFTIEEKEFRLHLFFDHYNRRLKVLDYQGPDYPHMIERLLYLAAENHFDKIILKAKFEDHGSFTRAGFIQEGVIQNYFRGKDAFVLSWFCSPARCFSANKQREEHLLQEVISRPPCPETKKISGNMRLLLADQEQIPALVAFYRSVFKTYPSPLKNPDYLCQTMMAQVIYRCVVDEGGEIVAAASAELDFDQSHAEIADCATREQDQGKGFMSFLVQRLEEDLKDKNISLAYALARSLSKNMNQVFFHRDYVFSGRMVNNCDICGQYEDMNIWVKPL